MSITSLQLDSSSAHIRTSHHLEFPLERILAAKGSTTISVCLPARNEETTVGRIVSVLHDELLVRGVIDEIVVLDDHSEDRTASLAREAGARVADAAAVLADYGSGHGKGEALWKSLHVTDGEIVLWCDSDITEFGSRFVTGLLGPLLCEPGVDLAKGYYRRPQREREGGGRVTELVARPLLSLYYPHLAALHQPLSGEYGGRREVLEQLPFFCGYGVDIGLLIDLADRVGIGGLVQVDLDIRMHRNRSLTDLGPQATAIIQTVLCRLDPELTPTVTELIRPGVAPAKVDVSERPPMVEVPDYRARRAASNTN